MQVQNELAQFREFIQSTIASAKEELLKQLQETEKQLLAQLESIMSKNNLVSSSENPRSVSPTPIVHPKPQVKPHPPPKKKKSSKTLSTPKQPASRSKSPRRLDEVQSQTDLAGSLPKPEELPVTEPVQPLLAQPKLAEDSGTLRPRTRAIVVEQFQPHLDLHLPTQIKHKVRTNPYVDDAIPSLASLTKTNSDTKTNRSKSTRIIGAALYKHILELKGRHTPAPARYKDSFSGKLTPFFEDFQNFDMSH
jgi:hypothetical protein